VVELCVSIYIHVMGGAPLSAIERFYGIHTTCVRECMGGGYRNRVEGMNKKNSDTKNENRRYTKRKKKIHFVSVWRYRANGSEAYGVGWNIKKARMYTYK